MFSVTSGAVCSIPTPKQSTGFLGVRVLVRFFCRHPHVDIKRCVFIKIERNHRHYPNHLLTSVAVHSFSMEITLVKCLLFWKHNDFLFLTNSLCLRPINSKSYRCKNETSDNPFGTNRVNCLRHDFVLFTATSSQNSCPLLATQRDILYLKASGKVGKSVTIRYLNQNVCKF